MPHQGDTLPPDPTWLAFVQRHAGHPFLCEDPLYALSENVIDAIKAEAAERSVPDLFTEQESFERDLARSARHGFFLGQPIDPGCVWVGEGEGVQAEGTTRSPRMPGLTVEEFLEQMAVLPRPRQQQALDHLGNFLRGQEPQGTAEEAVRAIDAFLRSLENFSARQAAQRRRPRRQQTEEAVLRQRQEAYAGWLVLNRAYRAEAGVLRQQCEPWIVEETRFPCMGEYAVYPPTPPREESGAAPPASSCVGWYDARPAPPGERRQGYPGMFLDFYQRWGLDRLLTWELPLPMGISCGEVSQLAGPGPAFDGVALLIPWPLLRGEQVDCQASLARLRDQRGPAHLVEWLTSEQEGKGGSAQITYQWLFFLYRVYELVLSRRYKEACKGHLGLLDAALASVLGRKEEVVRKQRQRLQAALRAAP